MSFAEQLAARAAEKKRASSSAAPSITTAVDDSDNNAGKATSLSLSLLEKSSIGDSSAGPDEPATPLSISHESGSDTDEAGNRSNNKKSSSSNKRGGRSKGGGSGVTSPQSTSNGSPTKNNAAATSKNEADGKSQKNKNKLIQKGSSTASTSSSSSTDYKSKADKYKSENKKLRIESLLLKAKLEKLELGKGSDDDSDSDASDSGSPSKKNLLAKENDSLRENMMELQEQNRQLEIKLLEKEESEKLKKRASDVDPDHPEKSHEELLEENVHLTQMLKEIGGLKELERLRSDKNSDIEEKDASIQRLQQQLTETKAELTEVTELKNAEIDVLRKQLNRAEHKQSFQDGEDEREKSWNKEREGLREEIRRLNLEVSIIKSQRRLSASLTKDDEEHDNLTSRYKSDSNGGVAPPQLDNADVASLESIIAMMRQTIDQCNKEKDVLEQRLTEEQERSQMELQAFAKTLEGVDDLRKSAEIMSREIRRIKVKGYRPTRTELFGTSSSLEGGRNFGELSAAVEASESMEEAIRLIESQNDAMEERRRMGVVASRAQAQATATKTSDEFSSWEQKGERGRYRGTLAPISDDREGGFLSFWNNASGSGDEIGGEKSKDEKKKKSKRREKKKKSADGGGSVLTSFF